MQTLTEARIQRFIDHAQLSLYMHERERSYRHIMEFVDELVDLMMEVRRERAALEEIGRLWEPCCAQLQSQDPDPEIALRMCMIAREALGLPADRPDVPAPVGRRTAST